jgi:SNF2 family DNA or RNA helicase
MTISIEKHVRGIAVSASEGLETDERTRHLEANLFNYQSFVSRGRLIVGIEAASILLDILGRDGVTWNEEVLSEALRRQEHRSMQRRASLEVASALEEPDRALAGYRRLHQLDAHQVSAVAAIVVPSLRGIAIFDEQGTGKTITALASFDWLRERGGAQRLLVIAPKSVLSSWQVQCSEFLGEHYRVVLLSGLATERRRKLLQPHDVLLVGYETAVASETILCTIVAARPASYMLVVDESYFVKNPATQRARVVARIREACERAVILCGTPAPNAAIDVVNQIDIADGGVAFSGRIISTETETAYAEVADALQGAIYLRRLKEEVLPEIPPKQIEKIYLELTKRQRALYDRARDELVVEVRGVDSREFTRNLSSFLAKRIRLLQICSHPVMLDPLYDEVPAKIRVLDRLLKELVQGQQKKVVIWSYFRASLSHIAERYRQYGVARIDGTVARVEDRIKAIEQFQNDPDTRLFVGNAAAAGAGITLTAAHNAVYESFSNQAAHYLQSIDRIHRRGQAEYTTYHILIAKHTVEEHEYSNLVRKERAGRELLGDHFEDTMTRERFLAELETTA